MVSEGDAAPDFTLLDQGGKEVSLRDFRGRRVVLYFFPKADTPGCTKQSCSLRDARPQLDESGAAVIGIGLDKPNSQKRFDEKYSLGFPLLSDPDGATAKAYGAWRTSFGIKGLGLVRSAYVIDEEGRVVAAHRGISPGDTVPEALAALGEKPAA